MNFLIIIACCFAVLALLFIIKVLSGKKGASDEIVKGRGPKAKPPKDNTPFEMLSDAEARKFLSDVTSGDAATLSAFDAAIKNPDLLSLDFSFFEDGYDECRAYVFAGHALNVSGRIKEIDWATGEVAVFDYFSAMFDFDDIKIPDNIEYYLIQKEGEIKRGEAPELVAALLRDTANKAGYEILHLNAGDDQYRFLLSPSEAAQKWNEASLARHMKVEIPQWDVPADFTAFKNKKQRREPRSKLVRHLQKQSERAQREADSEKLFLEKKAAIIEFLEKCNYQDNDSEEFGKAMMGVNRLNNQQFDITAKSFGNNYFVDNFDTKAFSLALHYKMLAKQVDRFSGDGISILYVPVYVMFSLIGKLSGQTIWTEYAAPYIAKIMASEKDNVQRISAQFPLMPLFLEEGNLAEKAHDVLSKAYNIDTRAEPSLLYEAMIKDRIKYTRLLPDLMTSMYASEPLSFIPLEILYVSTLIDMPLSDDLITLRDTLSELPVETDDGIVALKRYLASKGK